MLPGAFFFLPVCCGASRFVQTGTILIPDAVTAVVQLVTGIGLLGVAGLVTTSFVLRLVLSHHLTLKTDRQRFH